MPGFYTADEIDVIAGGLPGAVLKTADEIVNDSTMLQNDDHLFFTVGANEVFEFICRLRMVSDTFPADLEPDEEPRGTMIFTDEASSSELVVDYKIERQSAVTVDEKILVLARILGLEN